MYDIETLAKDFLEMYREDAHARIPPLAFMKRWREKGWHTPTNTREFMDLLPRIIERAKEMEGE